jgi:ferredoxin
LVDTQRQENVIQATTFCDRDERKLAGPSDIRPRFRDRRFYVRALRWTVRFVVLGGATYLLFAGWLGDVSLATLPAGLSPYVVLCGLIVAGILPTIGWLALLVGCLSVFRLRWFCRWVCPLGTCNELSTIMGKKAGLRAPRVFHIGHYLAFAALTGALLGFPILLWLDPLAILSSLGQPFSSARQFVVGTSGFLAAVGLSFLLPGIWCSRICPLGGLQEIGFVARRRMLELVSRRVFRRRQREIGTETALPVVSEVSDLAQIGRRGILAILAAGLWTYLSPRVSQARTAPLRPPGAPFDDRQFLALCVRCGNCIRACPTEIIRPQFAEGELFVWLAPRLIFVTDFCEPSCHRCAEVCPSGALKRFLPEEKPHVVIGKAIVDLDLCLLTEERECGICRSHCPYQAIRLQFREETYSVQPVVDLARCPGCGACETICPTTPEKAIRVVRVDLSP